MAAKKILVIVGSRSDSDFMQSCLDTLHEFGIAYEFLVSSAHRQPKRTEQIAANAEKRGYKVIICAAGMAAALPGVVAAGTTLPVIGVPVPGEPLGGLDALLSTVQMPGGIPVATVTLGSAGPRNAALLAVRILAATDKRLRDKYRRYSEKMA